MRAFYGERSRGSGARASEASMSCCQRTYGPGPCCSPEQTRVVHLIRSAESTTARGTKVQAVGAGPDQMCRDVGLHVCAEREMELS